MPYKRKYSEESSIGELLIGKALDDLQDDEWVGEICGKTGSARNLVVKISTHLYISNSIIEGEGCCISRLKKLDNIKVTFSGKRFEEKLLIYVWPSAAFMAGFPFICSGHILRTGGSSDVNLIKGTFKLDCFTGCGCEGAAGDFFLKRQPL